MGPPSDMPATLQLPTLMHHLLRAFSLILIACTTLNALHAQTTPAPLKVISHNVWYGFTKKPQPRHEQWLKWMASQSPDVVSLQELNGYTATKLAEDAKQWGHDFTVLLKEDGFPTGLTSRFPITDVKRIREGMHHGAIRGRVQGLWIYVIHFHPSDHARRVEEAAIIKADIATLPDPNPRVVLAGDFNGFSPADRKQYDGNESLVAFFKRLDQANNANNLSNGKISYEGINAILDQGFIDTIDHKRSANAPFMGTFPAALVSDEDHGTDRRLDYVFVTPNLVDRIKHASILRDDVTERLSDHIPVSTTLLIEPPRVFTSKPEMLQAHGAGEGPAWHPQLGLLTSGEGNINVRDRAGNAKVFLKDAGSNGLMFDREGRLVICEPVRRRVSRIEADGSTTVLAATYGGKPFNQPNDLTIDRKGRLYFSDPCYGDRSKLELLDPSGRAIEGVYRIDLDGTVTRIITHEVDRPNGLVITHDDRYLFVADNNNSEGGARKLFRFALTADGNIDSASQTLIYDWGTTRGPDGMKLDAEGRLYVAAGLNRPNPPHETADPATAGVYVFSPEGQLLDFAPIPRDETTNCGFGGHDMKTLFVTAGGTLWQIRTAVPGAPAWPPAASTTAESK